MRAVKSAAETAATLSFARTCLGVVNSASVNRTTKQQQMERPWASAPAAPSVAAVRKEANAAGLRACQAELRALREELQLQQLRQQQTDAQLTALAAALNAEKQAAQQQIRGLQLQLQAQQQLLQQATATSL